MARPRPVPPLRSDPSSRVKVSKIRFSSPGRQAGSLVEHAQRDAAHVPPRDDADRRAGRAIFAGVLEQVDQAVMEELGIDADQRQLGRGRRAGSGVIGQHAAQIVHRGPRRHRSGRRARSDWRSAPASIRAMSSRFATKRLSRSASAWIDASSGSSPDGRRRSSPSVPRDRRERRPEVMADRRQQCGAQPVALLELGDRRHLRFERDPLERQRRLVEQAQQQGSWSERIGWPASRRASPSTPSTWPPAASGWNRHSDAVSESDPRPAGWLWS